MAPLVALFIMKVSKIFHWLYLFVLVIPILAIPVFMIYSHRHDIDTYTLNVSENKVVDFNQQLSSISVDSFSTYENGKLTVNNTYSGTKYFQFQPNNYLFETHVYYFKNFYSIFNNQITLQLNQSPWTNLLGSSIYNDNFIATCRLTTNIWVLYTSFSSETTIYTETYPQIFDLTQMFGAGNEPTASQFDTWYNEQYYPYNTGHKQLLKGYQTITYNDTDIMSQFYYCTYNVIDKYANFNNYLAFGNLYDWLQLNVFNGTAPLVFFLLWQLLIYWLLVSVIWLVFDIAMYVPLLVHRWIDKARIE